MCVCQGVQAPLFLWTHLTEKDLQSVWQAGLESPDAVAVLQQAAAEADNKTHLQQAIELDLYKQTLRQGQVLGLLCRALAMSIATSEY